MMLQSMMVSYVKLICLCECEIDLELVMFDDHISPQENLIFKGII